MAKYTKRLALIATSKNLVKEIEDIVVKTLETKTLEKNASGKNTYSSSLFDINVLVMNTFGCRLFPITNISGKETFTKFAKEFGEVSPLVGALVEYAEDIEEIKRSGI